jgi:hypothetical protein
MLCIQLPEFDFVLIVAGAMALCYLCLAGQGWLNITGSELSVSVAEDLSLTVCDRHAEPIWNTSSTAKPTIHIATKAATEGATPIAMLLADAGDRQVEPFDDDTYRGQRIRLCGFAGTDAAIEVILALSVDDELLVQIEQTGDDDVVQRVTALYDWKLEPAADAYTIVPHGNGYLIRSDSAKEVELTGLIGSAWALPIYGQVRGDQTCYQIIETWWDAAVTVSHQPGDGTALSVAWEASQGKLAYPRRTVVRFARNMDHVGLAKAYRQYLIDRGEFTTLTERVKKMPALKEYLSGIEYRWMGWNPEQYDQTLRNIQGFRDAGLPVSFFYPKWPAHGFSDERSDISDQNAGWQGFLQPVPVPGGWDKARELAKAARDLGCGAIKMMVNPNLYYADAPAYDPDKATGRWPAISDAHAVWALKLMLDSLEREQFQFEVLYFDGFSPIGGHPEQHSEAGGLVSRRQAIEAQSGCFRENARRGIVPGGEVARFWSVADAPFFFFTDWASDRLRDGEPVPMFALVFHDCFAAHFAGGGFYNEGSCDWYNDRHPRLYELMYAALPSHNWLPGGSRVIEAEDWETDKMARRLKWLKRWHCYYQAICYSEMVDHRFLNDEHTLQRIEYANGVVAEFDLEKDLYKVEGIAGFSGDWEKPETVER